MAKKARETKLPAPFLKRVSVIEDRWPKEAAYPFNLPWLDKAFTLSFSEPVTIIIGENGTGKSTLIEALAGQAGFSSIGGSKDHGTIGNSTSEKLSGVGLADALRVGWLPKVSYGWFFRAESFFTVARYLDAAGSPTADFLSHSHGEGFLRFFSERTKRQGIYFFDEPESALSPRRQLDLLRHLSAIQTQAKAQVIMATHSPILMAVPGAQLLEVSRGGFREVELDDISHFRLYRAFTADPDGFVRSALEGDEDMLF